MASGTFSRALNTMKKLRLHKNLLHQLILIYLKRDFKIKINLQDEYLIERNLVSGKYIIVPTFSNYIDSNVELRLTLYNIIQHINHTITTISDLRKEVYTLKRSK